MNIVLQLTYDPQSSQAIAGAFVRGNTPSQWFREIQHWNIPLDELVCLMIPEHTGSIHPAGLFVVFNGSKIPDATVISHPYAAVGGKLFIPVHASLHPALSDDEMDSLLIWEWQVFHPGIGFVGFNKEDQQEPVNLLEFTAPLTNSWDLAHQGLPPMAKLHEISVDNPTQEQLLDYLQEDIHKRPLSEIPDVSGPPTGFNAFLDVLAKMIMLPFWLILKILSMLPVKREGKPNKWLQRFMEWMEAENPAGRIIDSLENKRNRELERLAKLFDENADEALKYAIPLASKYANRGSAKPTGSLGRHDTDFNVNNLGGGIRADVWNVDKYAEQLSTKYYKAAMQAEEAGDHKKAAYIFANLLANYQAAARVLQQGQYYREAAILYSDHLNKPLQAAECLEKGGLLLEAIEMYKGLEQYEKTGDLYALLAQKAKAIQHYQKATDVALLQKDHLKAAAIIHDKLHDQERAQLTLLDGWNSGNKEAECLKAYFGMVDEASLPEHFTKVFERFTAEQKQSSFLSVLVEVNYTLKDTAAKEAARDIAYIIISKYATSGDADKLQLLRHFLPEDDQLVSDYNLYKSNLGNFSLKDKKGNVIRIRLHQDVRWMGSATYYNQMLLFGQDVDYLYLVRVNTDGYQEHYKWKYEIGYETEAAIEPVYPFFPNELISGELLSLPVRTLDKILSLEQKTLPANRHFKEKLVIDPENHLGEHVLGFVFHGPLVSTLTTAAENRQLVLTDYLVDSHFDSYNCTLPGGIPVFAAGLSYVQQMIFRNKCYYFYIHDSLYRSTESGECVQLSLGADIFSIMTTDMDSTFKIIARTKKGTILIDEHMTIASEFFAADMLCIAKRYIPGDLLVLATEKYAEVYDISKRPLLLTTIPFDKTIAEVLSTGHKNECAILDNDGFMKILRPRP
jgi:hypothetical protein